MAEPAADAVALARLRATRVAPHPSELPSLRSLKAAARRAGRTLADVRTTAGPALLLGWPEGSEPSDGSERGVMRREPSQVALLTFAACLRACWPDPDMEPYPGRTVSDEQVLAALASLASPATGPGEDHSGSERHYKGAIRLLRATGLLDPDTSFISLGPLVSLWAPSDVAVLRAFHSRLPACPPEAAG
jgi:hypothetical protein